MKRFFKNFISYFIPFNILCFINGLISFLIYKNNHYYPIINADLEFDYVLIIPTMYFIAVLCIIGVSQIKTEKSIIGNGLWFVTILVIIGFSCYFLDFSSCFVNCTYDSDNYLIIEENNSVLKNAALKFFPSNEEKSKYENIYFYIDSESAREIELIVFYDDDYVDVKNNIINTYSEYEYITNMYGEYILLYAFAIENPNTCCSFIYFDDTQKCILYSCSYGINKDYFNNYLKENHSYFNINYFL